MAVVSVEMLSEVLKHHRLDAKFYDPKYKIDFSKGKWKPINCFLDVCQYGISQAMTEEEKGYPIFRMDDIKDGFLLDDEVKFLEIPKEKFDNFKLEVNDVLFNRVNSEEFVGRTGIFKLEGNYVFASYLIRLRVKEGTEITPDYLNIFLNTKYGKKQIHRFSRRAVNQTNVNAEELKDFKIALIDLDIQKELTNISDEIWKNIKISKDLYKKAENLLLEYLGLDEYKMDYELSYESTLSTSIQFNRIDAQYYQPAYYDLIKAIKNCPEGYSDLLKCVDYVKPNFNPRKYPDNVFNYVELSNIDASIGIINIASTVSGEEMPTRAKRLLKKDDVLASSVEGSVQKIALVHDEHEDYVATNGFFQFRSKKIMPEVLLVLCGSFIIQKQIVRECTGTILMAMPKDSLERIIVPIISEEKQKEIAEIIKESHSARNEAVKLLEKAKNIVEDAIEEL